MSIFDLLPPLLSQWPISFPTPVSGRIEFRSPWRVHRDAGRAPTPSGADPVPLSISVALQEQPSLSATPLSTQKISLLIRPVLSRAFSDVPCSRDLFPS